MKTEIIETYLKLKEQYGSARSATASFNSIKYIQLKKELQLLTSFLDKKDSISKRIYCLSHNIIEKPHCNCGKIIKTFETEVGFRKECPKCAMNNPNRTKKIKNTCLIKYGKTTNLQIEEVNEKRLKTHKSKEFSNKIKNQWNNYSTEDLKKRFEKTKKTNLEKYGAENTFSKDSSLFDTIQINSKQSIFKKYGVDNIGSVPSIHKKGQMTRIALGLERHPEQRDDVEKYYLKVWEISNKTFKDNYYEFTNNDTIKRSKEFHLDHIYSIHYGFINNILPQIIGHKNNLRLISASENTSKNKRCDITIEEILTTSS